MIEGTDLDDAQAAIPQNQVNYVVQLDFNGKGTDAFTKISEALVGTEKQFGIVLDGQVISAPTMNGLITDGRPQIEGNFTQASAKSLATSLKFGALPVAFSDFSVETVGPSLAGDQLKAGITAGIIGLILVMIYCLIYYRGLGIVVVSSLLVAGAATYAMVLLLSKTANFTLTLPGIAGLIVAVGITADSFIVYFERIRDEMRDGKSMRVAVEAGWIRARATCLAADAVSLLAAIVLYIFAAGVVRGFAFALGLSTLIDLVVFFWFTKPLVVGAGRLPLLQQRRHAVRAQRGDAGMTDRATDRGWPPPRHRGRDGLMGRSAARQRPLHRQKSIDFVGRKWLWYSISGVIVLLASRALVKGLNYGIEFTGGTQYKVTLAPTVDPGQRGRAPRGGRRASASERRAAGGHHVGQNSILSRPRSSPTRERRGHPAIIDTVDATWTTSPRTRSAPAGVTRSRTAPSSVLVVFLVLVVLFIWAYFREWKMSVAAIVALAHDVIITVGVYALSGFEVSPATVTGPADDPRLLALRHRSWSSTRSARTPRTCGPAGTTYAKARTCGQPDAGPLDQHLAVALIPVGAILYVSAVQLGSSSLKDLALALFVGMAAVPTPRSSSPRRCWCT
jgi:protein-export SecD/SecF family membrane protein